MQDKWFRWEREAAIHLLFPTLEGSMEPLKKYVGFGFPTNVLIFKEGIVTWCLPEDKFYRVGKRLRNIYQDPDREKEMAKDLKDALQKLQEVEKVIDNTKLQNINNDELRLLYNNLYQKFLSSYAIGAISTPLSFETEHYLKAKTSLTNEQLNILVAPKKDSYAKKADDYLLKTGNVEGFIERYFWLNNSYAGTSYLTRGEAEERLAALRSKRSSGDNPQVVGVKLGGESERLVELLRNYAVYKDERKENIFIFLHYFEVLLWEIAQRSNLTLDDIRNIFPWEIKSVLEGKLKSPEIQKRKRYCVVVWEEGKKKPEVFVGREAKRWEKTVSVENRFEGVVTGNPASVGKIKGRVRILLSAKDCNLLKKGEVLVTFMTSPDFMMAMRKASAIVTNLGGVTSHAAVISRELGIPCVVGTKTATQVLKDGDLVEVDANEGVVRILKA